MTPATLTVFVPVRLVNPLNAREHWAKRAKRARIQRDAVSLVVWKALQVIDDADNAIGRRSPQWRIVVKPDRPKRITLTAHVARKMDDDGLSASLKAIRDGLQDCGLIHDDGPDSGHEFTYHQRVARPTGVEICVALL